MTLSLTKESPKTEILPLYSFGSTQFNLPQEIAEKVLSFAHSIPLESCSSDGREETPHITVLYGLHLDHPEREKRKIKALLLKTAPIRIRLGRLSLFPSLETGQSYEVLKIDVMSEQLRHLHYELLSLLPVTQTHPVYRPHVTLAYLKVGEGIQWRDKRDFEGITFLADTLLLSDRYGSQTSFSLEGEKKKLLPLEKAGVRRPGRNGATLWHYNERGEVSYGPYIPPKGHRLPHTLPSGQVGLVEKVLHQTPLQDQRKDLRSHRSSPVEGNHLSTLLAVKEKLPLLQKKTQKDLSSLSPKRQRAALGTLLLLHTGLSPKTLSTLRHGHIQMNEGELLISLFPGSKSSSSISFHDPDLEDHLKERAKTEKPSQKILLEKGIQKGHSHLQTISDLESYLSPLGLSISALRIWAASQLAAHLLSSEENKSLSSVIKKVSEEIGQSEEETLSQFICPALLESYALHLWPHQSLGDKNGL